MADTKKNYADYLAGKAPLKNAVLFMDDDDKIQNFVRQSVRRSMWAVPLGRWKEWQDKIKKNEADDE
jgi:hypothetical protein